MSEFRCIFDPIDGALTNPAHLTEARIILRWFRQMERTPENLAREMRISRDDAWKLMRRLEIRPVIGRAA